jgi:hypothetical protein
MREKSSLMVTVSTRAMSEDDGSHVGSPGKRKQLQELLLSLCAISPMATSKWISIYINEEVSLKEKRARTQLLDHPVLLFGFEIGNALLSAQDIRIKVRVVQYIT